MYTTALKYNKETTYTPVPYCFLEPVLNEIKKIDPDYSVIDEASGDYPEDVPAYAKVNDIPFYVEIAAIKAHVYTADIQMLMNEIHAATV